MSDQAGRAATCLARVLQHRSAASADAGVDVPADLLIEAAVEHGSILPVGWMLRRSGALEEWPPAFVRLFRAAEREAVAVECARHADLTELLAALTVEGIRAMPFKGAALAHTHYPAPHVRPRGDTDVMISPQDVTHVHRVFTGRGYVRRPEVSGRLVTYQFHYYKQQAGLTHAYDMHWKISNVQALADVLTFDELWAGRMPLPALGASIPQPVHALALALIHLAGHHPGSRRLLWLYDLHLIAQRLSAEEWSAFLALLDRASLGATAREGLMAAHERFETPALAGVIQALGPPPEDADEGVHGSRAQTLFDVLRSDLKALPRWRDRGRLVREHLFPAPAYIRGHFGVRSNLLVPGLYLWRIVRGVPKWFVQRAARD